MPSNEREVPYTPRQWAQGDLIEAEKLKALENAVGAIDNDIVGNGTKITSKINQVVQVSENQPVDELNKVWVRSEIDSISVPTEEEFEIVKAKAKDANETIFYEKAPVSQTFTWHQGTIDETTGVRESSPGVSNAINTTISLPMDSKITKMHIENGYKMKIFKYAVADQVYIECDSQFVTGYRNTEDLWNVKFAILVMKSDESAILVSNPPTISYINGYGYTDDSLTTQGRAADAKAVGDNLNTIDGRLMILEQTDIPTLQSIATVETSTTASHAIAADSYFILNAVLYKATADIVIGDHIATTGTRANAAQVPGGAMGEVADLKSKLNAFDIAATAADVGKALKAKTVSNGKVTEYELGDAAVIDPTLSVSGEAADAKATGDAISSLQSAMGDLTDLTTEDKSTLVAAINEAALTGGGVSEELPKVSGWVEGKYYNTSGSSASVDIESPQNDANYETVVLPCNDYDYFVINSTGGEDQRAWAFLDENYTIILNANPISNCVNEVIQAIYGARYLIINKLITDEDCYIGTTTSYELAEREKLINVLDGTVESIPYINKDVRSTNRYNGKYGYGTLNDSGIIIKSVKNKTQQLSLVTDFLEVAGNTNYYFSYLDNGTRKTAQIGIICQYDSGKRFLSKETSKTNITTLENCKYIRLAWSANYAYRLNSDFMVRVGSKVSDYVPYTDKDTYVGSIKNELYSPRGENTQNSSSALSRAYTNSAPRHVCFGTIAIKSEYAITRIRAKISDGNQRQFNEIATNEWNRIAISGRRTSAGIPTLIVDVYFEDGQSHPYQYKDALGFDETAVFGSGYELSAESILLKLTDRCYEHEYFTLVTDCGVASPVSKIESPTFSSDGLNIPYIGFGAENEIVISSAQNASWSGWREIGTYGQSHIADIPIYNKVHGTLETDGMFSVIPLWGCWSENASGSNSHHGGHVFQGWTTDRQHRLTMAVNIYRDDEAAIFNYVPGDKEEGQISGEGKFLRLRLGADNVRHGVLLDNVYVEGQGYYTRLQINGPLNITADAPAAANADGLKGDVRFDQNYVYFCVADNTWKRIPLESWT